MDFIEKVKEIVSLVENVGLTEDTFKNLLLEVIEKYEEEDADVDDDVIPPGMTVSPKAIRDAVQKVHDEKEQYKKLAKELTDEAQKSAPGLIGPWWGIYPPYGRHEWQPPDLRWNNATCGGVDNVTSIPEFKFSGVTIVSDPSIPNCSYGFKNGDGSYICGKETCDCFRKDKDQCKK